MLLTVPLAAGLAALGRPASAAIPKVREQWYVTDLSIGAADAITDGRGVVVAVIDGGVDATHPKLAGQLVPGFGTGGDAAPDGMRDSEESGHGTAMAGIIAGRADVGPASIQGIAPGAKVMPISTGSEIDTDEVAAGIRYAVDHGAKVINMSLGSPGPATLTERSAVRYALDHDVVVVAAAGNSEPGDREINAPANIPGVIAVTGTNINGEGWRGSVTGPQAVVAAPAPNVFAPVPRRVSADGYDSGDGTSNSSAIVSGIVALIRAHYPTLDAANVIERLIATATDKGAPGRDALYGYGEVDPVRALTATVAQVSANPLLTGATPAPAGAGGSATGAPGGATRPPVPVVHPPSAAPKPGRAAPIAAIGVAAGLVVVAALLAALMVGRRHPRRRRPGGGAGAGAAGGAVGGSGLPPVGPTWPVDGETAWHRMSVPAGPGPARPGPPRSGELAGRPVTWPGAPWPAPAPASTSAPAPGGSPNRPAPGPWLPGTPVPTAPVPTAPVPTAPVPTAPVPTMPIPPAPVSTVPFAPPPVPGAPRREAPVGPAPWYRHLPPEGDAVTRPIASRVAQRGPSPASSPGSIPGPGQASGRDPSERPDA